MAPFRRGRSADPSPSPSNSSDHHNNNNINNTATVNVNATSSSSSSGTATTSKLVSAWDARRRRKKGQRSRSSTGEPRNDDDTNNNNNKNNNRRRRSSSKKDTKKKNKSKKGTDLPDEEYDPYDSDPGESYRDHCERLQSNRSKSCLTMPRFLTNHRNNSSNNNNNNKKDRNNISGETDDTEATSPPSPLASENLDDPLYGGTGGVHGGTPASLPRDLARVRYSLRTSIGDGTERQLTGPSMMERRELRPNNIHINVSHWSDFGGRNYMEDRYDAYPKKKKLLNAQQNEKKRKTQNKTLYLLFVCFFVFVFL